MRDLEDLRGPLRERYDVGACIPAPIAKLRGREREAETFCIRMQYHRFSRRTQLRRFGRRAARTIQLREFVEYGGLIDARGSSYRRIVERVGAVLAM